MKRIPLGFDTTEIEEPSLEDFKGKWILLTTQVGNLFWKIKKLKQ